MMLGLGCDSSPTNTSLQLDYPSTRVTDVKDTLWNTEVDDPYRWLEDDRSAETEGWVDSQISFTQSYLSRIDWREPLRNRFEALYNYEKIGMPRKIGNRYFLSINNGLKIKAYGTFETP